MSSLPTEVTSTEQFNSIISSSKIVVAYFFEESFAPCRMLFPVFESLSRSLSRPKAVTFIKIDSTKYENLVKDYGVMEVPNFLLFRDAAVIDKAHAANPQGLQDLVKNLASQVDSLGENEASIASWRGAEIVRGSHDITDQVEVRGCELLNSHQVAGLVDVLFDPSKPSALGEEHTSTKDWVQSGADDQLLLFIPFQSSIKLHTLQITSLPPKDQTEVSRPEVIQLYINRPRNMDFSEADDTEPTQTITLNADEWNSNGTINVGLRYVKFQKTNTLVVYVQKGVDGAESVRLDRVKIIGDEGLKREMGTLQKFGDGGSC
ncbi:hypothetical protein L249_3413 [Ophiocordyceps polyrhachis-furcata BCC 54312]|uniref:PITH domain-containing protein n=1 Tax=Ophiocordyceps polyrhachis-furcata BCC 54312 TaxID=1330021 RepID=A0A367LMF6_9HYPO|nr:hypothetical protein L249_3413 [Ophiocordyceps polyrhachis-furcata BCC 54312]